MKAVCKKLFSLMLVAILLVSAVPFQAFAEEVAETAAPTVAATEPAVVETEAPVAPAAEIVETQPVVEQEITVTTPAANAEVVEKDIRYIEFQVTVDGTAYRVGNLVKTKIGSKVGTPSESAVLNVVKSVLGTSDGYSLIRWEQEGSTFTSSTVINLSMAASDTYTDEKTGESYDIIAVDAIIEYVAKKITLKANGGTAAKSSMNVTIGKTYGECGGLPTPTRSGYEFQGWMKADGTFVTDESTVEDLSTLTAQWSQSKLTVVFWNYENEEVGFGSFNVEANSVLKSSYNNFPTEAQALEMFNADTSTGWWMAGWEYSVDGGKTFNTFKEGSTKITANTIIRPLYQKTITLYAQDSGNTTRKLTVTLGKNYPALPHPGTREGYAFLGWCKDQEGSDLVSSKENLSKVNNHPVVQFEDEALYAWWDTASTIYLYIHTNGNTDDHTKLVRYYDVPQGGLNLKDIDLASIFPNYGKYDDNGDEQYGWYSPEQWKNYVLGRHVNETTELFVPSQQDPADDIYEFYIMLIDNGNNTSSSAANGTGYNDNKTTVDSSNPSTGDDIFVAVTVMAVSACVLLLFFMNKKRIAK